MREGRSTAVLVALFLAFSGCAFAQRSPTSVEEPSYILPPAVDLASILKECYQADLGLPVKTNLKVNGHVLNATEAKNVQWIGHCVVPNLPGTAEKRADVAAKTTWWSLREGILDRSGTDAFRYANCHERGKDRIRSTTPLYNCPTNLWQVGIAAGQVMNYSAAEYSEKAALVGPNLDPKTDEDALLRWSATLAGFGEGTPAFKGILAAKGRVRNAWMLRNPLVGFLLVAKQEVENECLKGSHKWCTSGNYPAAVRFSHTRAGMKKAIADLKKIFLSRAAE